MVVVPHSVQPAVLCHSQSHPAIGMDKDKEMSIIIGCSIGAAFLLILINVTIICCVRRAKRYSGTLKTKYIIRPESLDGEDKVGAALT